MTFSAKAALGLVAGLSLAAAACLPASGSTKTPTPAPTTAPVATNTPAPTVLINVTTGALAAGAVANTTFTPVSGKAVTVKMTSAITADLVSFRVIDSVGNTVASSNAAVSNQATVTFTPPAALTLALSIWNVTATTGTTNITVTQ